MKQITEGIEASGSVAKNAGLDMQEYAAMVGVAVEKTGQSGSTIGNAYKTIFSRITKASEIEGTLSDDISKAEEALRGINVQVRSSNNDFRDMTDIMADIGKVWDGLTDTQKAKVGYEVAGIRQLNVLNSLFGAWDEYSAIVETSEDRVGMALKNQEEYADSLGGRLNELEATGKSVWNNLLNSDGFKGAISLLTDFLGLIDKITGALGTWGSLGLGAGLFAGYKNFGRPKMFGLKTMF
jgi:TP901 family phage tail tape measure protein